MAVADTSSRNALVAVTPRWIGAAAAGSGLAHAVAVSIVSRTPRGAQTLRATGHGYWARWGHAALCAAMAYVLCVLVAHAWTHFRRAPSRTIGPHSLLGAFARLAALQIVAFALTEATERVVAHDSLASALDHRVVVVGVAVQVVVAALLVQVLRLVRDAAIDLAERRARGPESEAPTNIGGHRSDALVPRRRWAGPRPSRAPPVAA